VEFQSNLATVPQHLKVATWTSAKLNPRLTLVKNRNSMKETDQLLLKGMAKQGLRSRPRRGKVFMRERKQTIIRQLFPPMNLNLEKSLLDLNMATNRVFL
jgi:hypothetical protein